MKRTIPVMLVLVFVNILTFAIACNSPTGGSETIIQGDGTKGNPFKVYDEATLQKISSENTVGGWTLSAHYIQIKDIQMSSTNFTAIGTSGSPFTGSYNGGGYTITGLTINYPEADCQGLFGGIGKNCIVENVGLIGVSIIGKNAVGGVVGTVDDDSHETGSGIYNVMIQNCYVTGSVKGNGSVGGVMGFAIGVIVQNCYAICSVESTGSAGGVVGNLNSALVQNCYSTSSVKGNDYVGGVVGGTGMGMDEVQNCVALNIELTSINNSANIGRIIGYIFITPPHGNYAKEPMTITSTGHVYDRGHDKKDGEDVNAGTGTGQYNNAEFWIGPSSTMGWDPDIWSMTTGTGNLPKLIGVGGQ